MNKLAKKNPLISVVVPVYKVEDTIRKCIDSLRAQTYLHIEILLIDDGSPDRCGEICDEYARQDARIVVIHQENQGVSAARNRGLQAAKGEYIAFTDSDDWVEPLFCEKLYETLADNKTEMAICGHAIYHGEDWVERRSFLQLAGRILQRQALSYLLEITKYEGYLWNKLFSKALLCKAGAGKPLRFDPEVHICEDLLFVTQCMAAAESVAYTPAVLYHYLIREGSALRSFADNRHSELVARQQIVNLLEPIDPALSRTAKARYVEAAINLYWFAAIHKRVQQRSIYRDEIKKYLPAYREEPGTKFKSKLRAFLILHFPLISYKIWRRLKKRFRLTW